MASENDVLMAGLAELGLPADEGKVKQLLLFLALMQKWNKAYNLSGVRDAVDMVRLHLLDSLAVLRHCYGGGIIDIGTGAGLPGIPLAIYLPSTCFVLLDSNAKKTRFVQQAIVELKLPNVKVLQTRVEAYQPEQGFNTVLTRAFASMDAIQRLTQHLLLPEGQLLAMKGQPTAQELQTITGRYSLIPLQVPGIDAERCLIRMQLDKVGQWEK